MTATSVVTEAPAPRLWLRAMIDLLRAGAIAARPCPFAAFGHDLR